MCSVKFLQWSRFTIFALLHCYLDYFVVFNVTIIFAEKEKLLSSTETFREFFWIELQTWNKKKKIYMVVVGEYHPLVESMSILRMTTSEARGYIGMCRTLGYGFRAKITVIYIQFRIRTPNLQAATFYI